MAIISAPQLLVDGRLIGPAVVEVDAGVITAVRTSPTACTADRIDLAGGILSAGLVDLQVNGFAGTDLVGATPAQWRDVQLRLARTGVTSFLATYITAPIPDLVAGLGRAAAAQAAADTGAGSDGGVASRLLGVHLEGPFLSEQYHGAHDPRLMIDPTPAAVAELLSGPPGVLALVTLAPERPGALAAIEALRAAGVCVSIGHTAATAAQVTAAADAGARMVTHVFNAQRGLAHREPGVPGQGMADPRLSLGLICDLHHVSEVICSLVLRAALGGVLLVTDAIAATTMPAGRYLLGGVEVIVETDGGLPRRADGTIAGSALTLDAAVRNAVRCGASPAQALLAATATPAALLGRTDVGDLRVGAAADLVWWSDDLQVQRVWVGGRPIGQSVLA